MVIRPLLGYIRWIVIVLLLTGVGTARAERRTASPQVTDGYTVTLSLPAEPAAPGDNEVVAAIRDASGRPVDNAEVSVALLAYASAVSANPNTSSASGQHNHSPGASSTEGQGLIPDPVRLEAGTEAGSYRGVMSFAKEGTWTVVVAFTTDAQSRAVLFKIGIIDQRPRLAIVGGFAGLNVAIIVAAALLKRGVPLRRQQPASAAR